MCDSDEKEETDRMEEYNHKLLSNILPEHVAQHFLKNEKNIDVSVAPPPLSLC